MNDYVLVLVLSIIYGGFAVLISIIDTNNMKDRIKNKK